MQDPIFYILSHVSDILLCYTIHQLSVHPSMTTFVSNLLLEFLISFLQTWHIWYTASL